MSTTYKPTDEQQAVIDACRTGSNVVVEAAAGAGKTSTLRLAAQGMRGRVLYVAYNKAAATEAKQSFPPRVRCSTVHGLAFGAVGRFYAHRLGARREPAKVTAEKLNVRSPVEVAGLVITPATLTRLALSTVQRFCQSADTAITASHLPRLPGVPTAHEVRKLGEEIPRLRREGNHEAAAEAHRVHGQWLSARHDLARVILPIAERAWADIQSRHGQAVPFTHDHYLKIWQLEEPVLRFDTVMLDEAQDSNPCRSSIIVGQGHAQRVAIGDGCQQLYAWQGAVDALATWPADTRLYLTQSWRFGEAVAREANKWLSFLDTPMRVRGNPNLPTTIGPLSEPDAVLCRSNAGAVAQVIAALDAGKRPALVGGADDLVRMAEAAQELQAGMRTGHPELWAFESWRAVQEYAEEESGSDLRVFVRLVDEHGPDRIIKALTQTVPERPRHPGDMYAKPKEFTGPDVVISTAHKSKGREWDRVQIHDDYHEPKGDRVAKTEAMLAYVTVTRARLALDRAGLSWVDQLTGTPRKGSAA